MDADEVTNRNTVSTKQSKLQFFRFVIEVECKKEFSNKLMRISHPDYPIQYMDIR